MTIRSNLDGESGVKVWLEFVPAGALRNFAHALNALQNLRLGGIEISTPHLPFEAERDARLAIAVEQCSVKRSVKRERTREEREAVRPLG